MPTKNRPQIGLVLVIVAIAVVMALPVSSLVLIAVTGLFVSTKTYEVIAGSLRNLFTPLGYWLADRYSELLDRFDDLRHRVFKKPSRDGS